ncbi:disease resistance protein At4g27190-like [Rosa rugosa]|uniref:disease resistance protein At4g27190-like n=1 Tax=Rosa rugosa TaxID=74645 RepID=UPI002B40CD27|nr:disease resistance protein At4g27190-like [Rosa rugosa]
MVFLLEIGTGIVGKFAEYMVEPIIRQVGYVIYYHRNLNKLQTLVGDLNDARQSMQHAVETEERKGKGIETGVQNWLTKVDVMIKEANDFLEDEHHSKTKCLHGFCPNIKLRHHLSRKSTKFVEEVAELSRKKDFANISYDVKPDEVCSISTKDYQAFDSRTSVAKKIMNELRQSNTDMIGVYGIGGVGKTTLAKEVYRQATEDKTLFDDVVIVLDVKKIPSLEGIQKRIAENLGMEFLGDETIDRRASRLCQRIKDKRVLVILDDIQEKVDLEIVGLPRVSNCKVLLTSRTREVLSIEMRTQKEFQLDLLNVEENWSLFEKMADDVVQNSAIREVATQVAEKCGGLPVLVVTVASALKNRSTLHDWKDALRRLKIFDKQGFTEKAYSALEWSYEQLDNEELKPLFLLCGVMRDEYINLDALLKCSMGLGLIKNVETMEEAQDALHSLVEKLKDSCLLLPYSDDNEFVRMHDLVHEVVNRIASRDQYVFKVAIGDEFKEWPAKDFCTKCTMIILKRCSIPHLPEGLECPELKMFNFSSRDVDHYLEIPSNFFEWMKKLRVLDFTYLNMPSLPPSLQFLKSLQTLCLDECTLGDLALVGELKNLEILSLLNSKFNKLPKEIGQLTRLRLLDLDGCFQLKVISPNVISNLIWLENLRMADSFNRWEGEGVISSERRNANLEELKHLPQLTALKIHIPDANILPADLFTTSKLKRFQIYIGSAWRWDNVDEALNALKLQLTSSNELDQGLRMLLERTEALYLEGTEGVNSSIIYRLGVEGRFQKLKHLHVQTNAEFMYIVNGKVGYPNLTWLAVNDLNGLRFLLSSSMARSLAQLKRLQVSGCRIMEEILSIEESDEEIVDNLFCQLQDLELKNLPNLTKFCSRNYSYPAFGKLQLADCIKTNASHEEIEETDSTRNLDVVIQHVLFDNKVEFPNLKMLSIDGLAKLTTIWNNQLSLESSKNLEKIKIVSCDSLKSIFPISMARSLEQLKMLIVSSCGVREIVAREEGLQTIPKFVFPKVTKVIFRFLSNLTNFYPGMHVSSWPLLNQLKVMQCAKVKVFAAEISSFQGHNEPERLSVLISHVLFLIERVRVHT